VSLRAPNRPLSGSEGKERRERRGRGSGEQGERREGGGEPEQHTASGSSWLLASERTPWWQVASGGAPRGSTTEMENGGF
jgi:hypothetical protein